jgi:flagellar hook-associated protein 2
LTLDSTKLEKALTDNPSAVKDLIVGDGKTTGITTTMATKLTDWLSTKASFRLQKMASAKR